MSYIERHSAPSIIMHSWLLNAVLSFQCLWPKYNNGALFLQEYDNNRKRRTVSNISGFTKPSVLRPWLAQSGLPEQKAALVLLCPTKNLNIKQIYRNDHAFNIYYN